MSRKTTIIEEPTAAEAKNDNDPILESDEEALQEFSEKIAKLQEELGDQKAKVTIERRPPKGEDFLRVPSVGLDEFDLDQVIQTYGGGTYRIRVRDENSRVITGKTIGVDPRLRGNIEQTQGIPNGTTGADGKALEMLASKVGSGNSDIAQLMVQMMAMQREQSNQTMQMFVQMQAQKPPSVWKEIAPVLASVTPLLVKLIENKATDNTVKTIEMIAKIKDLFPGDSGGGDWAEKMLGQLGPVVAGKILAGNTPTAAPVQQVEAPPPQAQIESGPTEQTVNTDDPMIRKTLVCQFLRQYYPQLTVAAKKGSNVEAYFTLLADRLDDQPDWVVATLREILTAPDWTEQLFGQKALPNPDWFEAFRKLVLEYCEPDPEEVPAVTMTAVTTEPPTEPEAPRAKVEAVKGGKK